MSPSDVEKTKVVERKIRFIVRKLFKDLLKQKSINRGVVLFTRYFNR